MGRDLWGPRIEKITTSDLWESVGGPADLESVGVGGATQFPAAPKTTRRSGYKSDRGNSKSLRIGGFGG
eukprot:7718942-Pyramimonas_sp.AAC.1